MLDVAKTCNHSTRALLVETTANTLLRKLEKLATNYHEVGIFDLGKPKQIFIITVSSFHSILSEL